VTGWILRVEWPIHDPAMYDTEAITEAWFQLPGMAEEHQVTFADQPKMRVVALPVERQLELGATRAVVCEAPVFRRTTTNPKEKVA
jgi:hypothetical protein